MYSNMGSAWEFLCSSIGLPPQKHGEQLGLAYLRERVKGAIQAQMLEEVTGLSPECACIPVAVTRIVKTVGRSEFDFTSFPEGTRWVSTCLA